MSEVKTRPFDAANYLDDEEAIEASLADARAECEEILARAQATVERARIMHALANPARRVG